MFFIFSTETNKFFVCFYREGEEDEEEEKENNNYPHTYQDIKEKATKKFGKVVANMDADKSLLQMEQSVVYSSSHHGIHDDAGAATKDKKKLSFQQQQHRQSQQQ